MNPVTDFPRFSPAGDQALVAELGPGIARSINARVRALDAAVKSACWPEIIDSVPSYRSLLVYYDPAALSYDALKDRLLALCGTSVAANAKARRFTLPVLYGAECDADLQALAQKLGMHADDVVAAHCGAEYMVYMVGFSPGFAYLGELPKTLEVQRKLVPARSVPANSIQVGGAQTAVSSMPMPSGWYVIGRTPLKMYDLRRDEPFLLQGGDLVNFQPVSASEFARQSAQAESAAFMPNWEPA